MMTSPDQGPALNIRPGWALPSAAYHDPAIYRQELTDIFHGGWLFAATSAQLANPGDTLTWTVGSESVVLARTISGTVAALHNTCRHRGCRIAPDGAAQGRALVCPYHNWAYRLDGSFAGAPHMGDALTAELRSELGLIPMPVTEFAGLIFVCFSQSPPPIERAREAITAHVGRYRAEATQITSIHHYEVDANWKVLVENNRECYHCSPNHPEFCLSNYELGMPGDSRTNQRYQEVVTRQRHRWSEQGLPVDDVSFPDGDFFRVARLPLKDGYLTESMSGQLVGPLLGDLTSPDVGSIRIVTLPNSWIHVNADYVMATRLTPIDENTTHVDVTFQVRDGARTGIDYEIDDVAAVWVATSEQDWALCEKTYAGIRSAGYRPGPLSPVTEGSVVDFHIWWAHRLGADVVGQSAKTIGNEAVS